MDQNSLDNAIAAASALINNPTFNALVESKTGCARRKKNGGSDISALEAEAFGGTSSSSISQQLPQIPKNANKTTNSKMPSAILESFKEQPSLSYGMDMVAPPVSYTQPTYSQPKQIVTEQIITQPQTSGIDYNALKFIINECIKENLKTINESNNLVGVKVGGGKIQVLDTKGNVYEGVLTLKKKGNK